MKRLFGDPLQKLRPEERAAFLEEQNVARFYRAVAFARFSAVVMVVLLVLVDVLDVARLDPFAMRISLVGHLLLLGVTIGFLVYARRDPVDPSKGTTRRQRFATHVLLTCLYAFLWSAFLMTFLRNGNPSIHHIGVFSVAVALPFARLAPVLFLGDLALFFLALGLRPGTDIDFYLSGAVTNGLAMLFARLMLEGRVRDFHARRTIEIQARDRSEVLAIAAHDLKNPLNGIKGYSEMILEDPEMPPEEREDALRRILASAARMHELVRNLLDINALEDGKLALNVAPCDLGEVLRGVGESYAPAALAKRQTLLVLASSAPLVADRAVLVQVTDNLVSNAVKYSRPEGRIELRTECARGRVRLVVKDDGPGFTEDDRKKLFGKFARLSARPTAGEHSNGLGLSIVKRLIEATGGTVALESAPGEGATFVVEWITTA